MKGIRLLARAALLLAIAAPALAQNVQIDGAGATFPYPDLFEVVLRVQQAPSRGPDQLPVDRIGRRNPPAHQPDRLLRSDRRSDDPGSACRPRSGKVLHLPTVLGGVVPIYNIPGVDAELKFTGTALADIILGKITKWNDPAIAASNPGRQSARLRHHGRASLGRVGHDLHLRGLPVEGLAERSRRRSVSPPPSTGPWASAERATKASPGSSSRRRARSATSS